jgi:hypothetical protein
VPVWHGPDEAGAEPDRPEESEPRGAESETTPEPWFFRIPAPVVAPPPVAEEAPAYVPEEPRPARRLPRGVWIGVLAVAVGLIMIALVTTGGRQVRPSGPTSQAANPGPVSAWVPYTDEATGFTLRHPPMWSVRRDGSQTYFIDPATKSYLQVDHQEPPAPSPLGLWQDLEKRFVAQHPSYAKIQLADSMYQGFPAAVWEFTYSDGGVDVHAIDLGFSAGRYGFALLFQTPASEWARLQSAFESFKSVFRPPG